jgi:ATP-dependent RNA helicase DeaD
LAAHPEGLLTKRTGVNVVTTEFTEFNLHPALGQAVTDLGYTTPTPIQTALIPVMITGQDVIGQAKTGTGKTAAFALPILHNLAARQNHVQALVLAPTRELAIQVSKAMTKYGQHLRVRVLPVYGGQPYGHQIDQLNRGVDIVVGTPGRILDLIKKRVLKLGDLRTLVLDEADEMLSMGFIEDIETILSATPATRQTALFSATMPQEIRRLANSYMQDPKYISVGSKERTVEGVDQRWYLINDRDKLAALTRLVEIEPITSALIFARTRVGTGELAAELTSRGFPSEALNGDMSQEAREHVLARFRRGQIKMLVATDVAARGLDIDDLSHVFNFDLPQDTEGYVHRIGRTGRAGKGGTAITLLSPREQWRLRRIEGFTRQKITRAVLPTMDDVKAYREAQLMEQFRVWLRRGRCRREQELVTTLVEEGHDLLELASVALKMARSEEKQRPIDPVSEVVAQRAARPKRGGKSFGRTKGRKLRTPKGDKSSEKGMVRLSLGAGKAQGVRPNDVVGTIAYHADIPGKTIGAIHIQDDHTWVDVPEQYAEKVLAKTGAYRIRSNYISIQRA